MASGVAVKFVAWLVALLLTAWGVALTFRISEGFYTTDFDFTLLAPLVAVAAAVALGSRVFILIALLLPAAIFWATRTFVLQDGCPTEAKFSFGLALPAYVSMLAAAAAMTRRRREDAGALALSLLFIAMALCAVEFSPDSVVTLCTVPGWDSGWQVSLAVLPAAVAFWAVAARELRLRVVLVILSVMTLACLILFDSFNILSPRREFQVLGDEVFAQFQSYALAHLGWMAMAAAVAGRAFALLRTPPEDMHQRGAMMALVTVALMAGPGLTLLIPLEVAVIREVSLGGIISALTGDPAWVQRLSFTPLNGLYENHSPHPAYGAMALVQPILMALILGAALLRSVRQGLAVLVCVFVCLFAYERLLMAAGGLYLDRQLSGEDVAHHFLVAFNQSLEFALLGIGVFIAARIIAQRAPSLVAA